MNNSNKENNIKEKLNRALNSTERVISDNFVAKKDDNQNKSSKKFDFFNLESLNSKSDFIKARAHSDSAALKKNFLMKKFIKNIYLTIHLVNLFMQLLKKSDMNV